MKISELYLFSDDLKETEQFYGSVLELDVVSIGKVGVSIKAGNTLLHFKQSASLKPCYHFAFDIPYTSVEEACRWISKKLTVLTLEHESRIAEFSNWNARSFYFTDNNGNILEFIGRAESSTQPIGSFSSKAILYISEIGIVTENVPEMVKWLGKTYGLPVFNKQPPLENFAVMGNDSGLLIISRTSRNWYPTEYPAKSFPAEILFSHSGIDHSLVIK